MADFKNEDAKVQDYGYQVDEKGRRYSRREGEFVDESGRRFSGYDNGGRRISIVDEVFGEIKEGGPNYRDVRDWAPAPP